MRWIYKTVHYELKKEGILGPAFLDENEIEESLNEYGKAGWELFSTMEISDGFLAIFKQPFPVAHKKPMDIPPEKKVQPEPQATAMGRHDEIQVADENFDESEKKKIGVIRIE